MLGNNNFSNQYSDASNTSFTIENSTNNTCKLESKENDKIGFGESNSSAVNKRCNQSLDENEIEIDLATMGDNLFGILAFYLVGFVTPSKNILGIDIESDIFITWFVENHCKTLPEDTKRNSFYDTLAYWWIFEIGGNFKNMENNAKAWDTLFAMVDHICDSKKLVNKEYSDNQLWKMFYNDYQNSK